MTFQEKIDVMAFDIHEVSRLNFIMNDVFKNKWRKLNIPNKDYRDKEFTTALGDIIKVDILDDRKNGDDRDIMASNQHNMPLDELRTKYWSSYIIINGKIILSDKLTS